MNASAIQVDSLRFELELGFGLSAPAIQDRIGAFCRIHLPLLLQRAVQASILDGFAISVDSLLESLNLDVGDLPVAALESTLLARLEAALLAALRRQGQADTDVAEDRLEPITPSLLAEAVAFLSHGVLPAGQQADNLMSLVLEKHPTPLLLALRRWGRQAEARQRLARSLKQKTIERVVRLCVPSDADGVIAYTHDLTRLHHDRQIVADSEAGFRATIWEVVLAYLLADRGSRFNTRSFVARTLQQMAARYRIDYLALLAEMADITRRLRLPLSSGYNLPQLLLALYQDHVTSGTAEADQVGSEIEQGLRSLRIFLEHGVMPLDRDGATQDLTSLIEALLEQAPDHLYTQLVISGRSEVARVRIARQIPQALFDRLVCLLEPNHGLQIQTDLTHLRQAQARTGLLPMTAALFHVLLAELTLSCLLVERVAHFNQHAFLSTLLRQLAAHGGFTYPALLRGLMLREGGGLPVRWLHTLRALNGEATVGVQSETEADTQDLFLRWLSQEANAVLPDVASRIRSWLGVLAQREPEKLRRLLRATGRDGRLAARLAAFSDSALKQRLLILLAPGTHAKWNDCLALIRIAHGYAATDTGSSISHIGALATWEETFWTAAFAFLLREPGNAGMADAYRKIGYALMQRHGMSADVLRAFIAPALRDADTITSNRSLLDALTHTTITTQQEGLSQRQESQDAKRQQLLDWLEFGITPALEMGLDTWLRGFDDRALMAALRSCTLQERMLNRVGMRAQLHERVLRLLCIERGMNVRELDEVRAALKLLDTRPARGVVNRFLLAALLSDAARDIGTLLRVLLQALAPMLGRNLQVLLQQLRENRKASLLSSPLRHALTALENEVTTDGLPSEYRPGDAVRDDHTINANPGADHAAMILHYLREGKLPHWYGSATHALLRRWMTQGDPWKMDDVALERLRAAIAEPGVLRRLQQHLSRTQVMRLATMLAPDFGGFAVSWLMAAEDLVHDRRITRTSSRFIAMRHVQAMLIQLSQSGRWSSAAVLLRTLGEAAAAACMIAPAVYWECLYAAAVRRSKQDARFLPLIQTMRSARLVTSADRALFINSPVVDEGRATLHSANASTERVELDPISTLKRYLRFGEGTRTQIDAALRQASSTRREELRRILRAASGRELERARMVHGFSAATLQQSLRVLLGQYHAVAAVCIAALQAAMDELAGGRDSARWGDACIDELLRSLYAGGEPDAMLQAFMASVAKGFRHVTGVAVPDLRLHALRTLQRMRTQAALPYAQRLLATLPDFTQESHSRQDSKQSESAHHIARIKQRTNAVESQIKEVKEQKQPTIPQDVQLAVDNAGLVLLWPFLERYFSMVGLLSEREFAGPVQRMHAIQLTQFLVCGTHDAPESKLLLNKVLCGYDSALPIDAPWPPSEKERETGEQLLRAVIQHWSKLGSTTIEGLRETFLMRDGVMSLRDNGWHLQVQRGPFDVLMTFLPWSISTIRLPWMEKPLWVEWI